METSNRKAQEQQVTTLNSPFWRTIDVARRAGYSVQQVRNLERDGVLPPAARTTAGYRVYGERHLWSALAYRALATATGPVEAKRIVRAVHERPAGEALALLDAAHARLDRERTDLALAEEAALAISKDPVEDVRPSDSMSVSELATALGVRPSTRRRAGGTRPGPSARGETVRAGPGQGRPDRAPTTRGRLPDRPAPRADAGSAERTRPGGRRCGARGPGHGHRRTLPCPAGRLRAAQPGPRPERG